MRRVLHAALLLALPALAPPVSAQAPIPNDPFLSVPAPPPRPRPAAPPRPAPPPSGFPVGAGRSFRDCADCPEMVVVPAGRFRMGSPATEADRRPDEGPQREVTLRSALAVGRFHVTVGEYRAFAMATGRTDGPSCFGYNAAGQWADQPGRSWRSPGFAQTDRDPVVCVNWEDAQAYARWLAQRTGRGYRLPTEAEWEYAARAGTTTRWWWGEDAAAQCRHANGADQTARDALSFAASWTIAPCRDGFATTAPVGRFTANRFGLHDMGGNAWQWVQDCYRDSYAGAPLDASQAVESGGCSARVRRGGSWNNTPQDLRAANRGGVTPGDRSDNLGFRVARTPGG